jgi:serine/alanine racemase
MISDEKTSAVDAMKFFCAFLVLSIHTQPFSFFTPLDQGLSLLNRVAVPYFFIAAAYFFFSGTIEPDVGRLKKYVGRLLRLYLLWSAVYLPFTVAGWLADGVISFGEIARYGLKFFFLGSYVHLWFLIYLAYAVALVFFLWRTVRIKGTVIIAMASYALGLLLTTYAAQPVMEAVPGVFFALPCVAAGLWIARRGLVSRKTALVGTSGFFLLYTAERIFGHFVLETQSTVLWLFLLPLCVFLFLLTLKIKLPQARIFRALRHASVIIYASHYLFIRLFSPILSERPFWLFAAVAAASGALATVMLRFKRFRCFY